MGAYAERKEKNAEGIKPKGTQTERLYATTVLSAGAAAAGEGQKDQESHHETVAQKYMYAKRSSSSRVVGARRL